MRVWGLWHYHWGSGRVERLDAKVANCANLMNSPQSLPRQHATVETHAIHILVHALHRVLHQIIAIPLAVEEDTKFFTSGGVTPKFVKENLTRNC